MVWCLVSVLVGAVVFGAGIMFERLSGAENDEYIEQPEEAEIDPVLSRQWEKLLGYDGTEQEEIEYEDR